MGFGFGNFQIYVKFLKHFVRHTIKHAIPIFLNGKLESKLKSTNMKFISVSDFIRLMVLLVSIQSEGILYGKLAPFIECRFYSVDFTISNKLGIF